MYRMIDSRQIDRLMAAYARCGYGAGHTVTVVDTIHMGLPRESYGQDLRTIVTDLTDPQYDLADTAARDLVRTIRTEPYADGGLSPEQMRFASLVSLVCDVIGVLSAPTAAARRDETVTELLELIDSESDYLGLDEDASTGIGATDELHAAVLRYAIAIGVYLPPGVDTPATQQDTGDPIA
jgi:hypothetical protein